VSQHNTSGLYPCMAVGRKLFLIVKTVYIISIFLSYCFTSEGIDGKKCYQI